jgi:hypothetical protein
MSAWTMPLELHRERSALMGSTWATNDGRLMIECRQVEQPSYTGSTPLKCITLRVTFLRGRANPVTAGGAALAVAVEVFKTGGIGHLDAFDGKTREHGESTVYTTGFFNFHGELAEHFRFADGELPAVTRVE